MLSDGRHPHILSRSPNKLLSRANCPASNRPCLCSVSNRTPIFNATLGENLLRCFSCSIAGRA